MPQVGQALTKSYTGYIITQGVRNCVHVQKAASIWGEKGGLRNNPVSVCNHQACGRGMLGTHSALVLNAPNQARKKFTASDIKSSTFSSFPHCETL